MVVTSKSPDLIVGVDFGTTCTGVAYQNLHSGMNEARYMQRWPGRANANENKVKTLLAYRDINDNPLAWGFAAERSDNGRPTDVLYKEYFKIFLDPKELKRVTEKAPENAPASMQEVEKMYLDYLTCLYNHIKAILSGLEFPDRPWEQVVIEYIFSVPTTWTDQNVIERFRNIAQAAGFGSVRSHQLTIGLTEAEAAAVHVSKGQPKLFSAGDVLLMCDAGGGTTDLSVLQISSNVADILDLRQVDYVNGKAIGSVAIDDDFCNLVSERLFKADAERPLGLNEDDIHQQAWEVSLNSFFQDTKCSFGDSNSRNFASTDTFACPLRRVPYAYVNDKRGIRGQEIKITFQALQTIFDKQVDKLFRHIDSQIKRVARHRIRYLILSGGLGHSQYVQQRLKQRYETDMEAGHAILVRVANDPQLAVCIGLVRDRVQRLDSGRSALSVRVCRESYGVQCDIDVTKGDQKLYGEARKEKDSRDQKDYYKNCIRWLIKQGEPVHADEANSWNFCRLFAKGQKDVPYTVRLLKSSAPADSIPHVVALGANVQEVCLIRTSFAAVTLTECEERNKPSFMGRKKKEEHHYAVKFQIKAVIGPADLKFELWLNGRKISADHAIEVEWLENATPQ